MEGAEKSALEIIILSIPNPSRHDWKIVDWDVKPQHKNLFPNCDFRAVLISDEES